MEKDDEWKGVGNSYTTFFRQYDPRIGRWLSIDPETAILPHQSPYTALDNSPISLTDPFGDCTSCPDEDNYEGRQHMTDDGRLFIYSNDYWTPGSDYEAWIGQNGGDSKGTYFDYYAGKYGYDPSRADWDMGTSDTRKYLNAIWFQNLYNNDGPDELLWH